MNRYGARELAASFRTVRKNTIAIAEDIAADKYGFRPTPDVMSVGEQLAHVAVAPGWQIFVQGEHVTHIDFALFGMYATRRAAEEKALTTKDDILKALRDRGEQFAAFLESLSEDTLDEVVTFQPPIEPATKTRFEMLLGVKEHEMHHRAQLMLFERLLGIVPHLTRRREAFRASMQTQGQAQQPQAQAQGA
ncbi:MAG TPA: DinB family protein [Vicinamibacterales bacterium]|jgi:uncharacterized damage-inducible protein DinB|nr:DinB family protein [Vicinamibacterales bacterium]